MKIFERLSFLAGLLLLVWLVSRVGLDAILAALAKLGWGFAVVLALYALTAYVNTLAWRATMARGARVGVGALFAFLLAGDAVNALTPSAVVGGELIRLSLLRRKMPTISAAASVTLAAATQFVAQLLFLLAGVPLILGKIPVGLMRTGLLATAGIAIAAGAAAISLARRGSLFERLHGLLVRWIPGRLRPTTGVSQWRELDVTIGGAIRHPWALGPSLLLYLLGWVIGVAEVALILSLVGAPVAWGVAATIQLLAVIIDTVLFFVPGRLGTQEGGKFVIFQMLGLDPRTGFALGFVIRLRELAWALAGIAMLGYLQRKRMVPNPRRF